MRNIHTTLVNDPLNGSLRRLRFVTDPAKAPTTMPPLPENPLDTDALYEYYLNREDHRVDADLADFIPEDTNSDLYRKILKEFLDMHGHFTSAVIYYLNNPQQVLLPVTLECAMDRVVHKMSAGTQIIPAMLKLFYTFNAEMVVLMENTETTAEYKAQQQAAYTLILQIIDLFFLRLGFDHFRVIASQATGIIRDSNFTAKALSVLSRDQGNYGFPAEMR